MTEPFYIIVHDNTPGVQVEPQGIPTPLLVQMGRAETYFIPSSDPRYSGHWRARDDSYDPPGTVYTRVRVIRNPKACRLGQFGYGFGFGDAFCYTAGRVTCAGGAGLYAVNGEGTGWDVSRDAPFDGWSLEWSSDGSHLAWAERLAQDAIGNHAPQQIVVEAADGSGRTVVSPTIVRVSGSINPVNLDWSP